MRWSWDGGRGARFRLVLIAGFAVALVFGAVVERGSAAMRDARLLRADPQAIAQTPVLLRQAEALAVPAYAAHCAGCHGRDLRGDRVRGVPDLIDDDWLYGSGRVAEIEQTILYGVRSGAAKTHDQAVMPAFGRATPSARYHVAPQSPGEIDDVTQYVVALGRRPADAVAVARGRRVFANTGGCYDCHAADGGGDPAIGAPRLSDGIWLHGDGSPAAIRDVIVRGRRGVCPAWNGRLPPATIRALAVYVHDAAATPRTTARR